MSEKQINWCTCKGHDHKDWCVRSELCARCFVPTTWVFEHHISVEDERKSA